MRNSTDPSLHREAERAFVAHVEKLVADDRLRVDTTRGRRPITALIRAVSRGDRAIDVKRLMSEMNKPDRELQNQMPIGQTVEVGLARRKWMLFKSHVGRVRVMCVSPTRALIAGTEPKPLTGGEIAKLLSEVPPPLGKVPSTIVLMSTSGFTLEAHESADRRSDRTVILVEPNDAGGWRVYSPADVKSTADLFDPEAEEQKRKRVREAIDAMRVEMLSGGVSADRVAARTGLAVQLVEAQLKSYAKQNPGLAARRLDGKVVLFREGPAPAAAKAAANGGSDMPFIDRMKTLFARKGETEKKIAFLAERRAALSQQRDAGYDDMGALEAQEADLREQFKTATGDLTKRRVTSQLLQLRKDIERRQQLLSVLNQQINVVNTHLHNLELVQQGKTAKLPDSEEMASDAAAAEEVLAELEASSELAGSIGAAGAGMSAEEQALYDELERESKQEAAQASSDAAQAPATAQSTPAPPSRDRATPQSASAVPPLPKRSEPEAG